ncbi:MAG TPA: Gfo/Idh/MocA family oxidoreductase [Bryobacteraceae bacterium]|nr:Gfo/Idh/MocA family oxidoreductase [Bryobacteraceae bacterium]
MAAKIRWGVLGVARIATAKVIPAMQRGEFSEIAAIASRDGSKAREAAERLGIARWYGSYEELMDDRAVDAIYNPLPNHLHVPWSVRAARAGKHVLCEKPIAMSAGEARELIAVREESGVKMGEAFMARTHPQWLRARELVRSGAIGELRVVAMLFSYSNTDAANVRNIADWGGGALMDIGCYPITFARMMFGEEPARVIGSLERDPNFHTDRLTSAILEFPSGRAVFTCSTQLAAYQRAQIMGTRGRIEIEIPVNAPPEKPARIFVNDVLEEMPRCDQYTIQGDLFSRAILENGEVPVTLEDALRNMETIDAIFRSAKSGAWETPGDAAKPAA